MSKTDKTRPWWVQMADAPMVTCVPVHDHRFGSCTLPDEITADSVSPSHRTSGCYWGVTNHYWYGSSSSDGCRECTGYYTRREERRRSRHQARRDLRTYHNNGCPIPAASGLSDASVRRSRAGST